MKAIGTTVTFKVIHQRHLRFVDKKENVRTEVSRHLGGNSMQSNRTTLKTFFMGSRSIDIRHIYPIPYYSEWKQSKTTRELIQ